jgi:hypothetical protein
MKLRTDIERHGARIAVAFAVLTVYQAPAPSQTPVPRAPEQARTSAPAIAGASSKTGLLAAHTPASVLPVAPVVDPFAATSWASAAHAVPDAAVAQIAEAGSATPAAATSAPPSAPPLPFVYIGRYVEGQRQVVMLMKGDQLLLLAQGDTIDDMYRIERITADRIELTYLPLGMRQSMRTFDSA